MQITKSLRTAVSRTAEGMPSFVEWFGRMAALGPVLQDVAAGIYCGETGVSQEEIPGTGRMLVMGWAYGRVEYAYVSI